MLGWFLAQTGQVRGFSGAVFSGFPTVVLARVIRDFVLPNRGLAGVYHVSADAIDKVASPADTITAATNARIRAIAIRHSYLIGE